MPLSDRTDARIPLLGRTAQPLTAFLRERKSQRREEKQNQLLEFATQRETDRVDDRTRRIGSEDQAAAQAQQQAQTSAQQLDAFENISDAVNEFGPQLEAIRGVEDLPPFIQGLQGRRQQLIAEGRNTDDTDLIISMAQAGDIDGIKQQFEDVRQINRQLRANALGVELPGAESFSNVKDLQGGGIGGISSATGQFGPIAGSGNVVPSGKNPLVQVNTGQPQPTVEQITQRKAAEARGTESVNLRSGIREAAQAARTQINQVNRFRQLSTNTETGFFEPTINNLRSIGKGLGINVDEQALASGEGISALAVPFTLQIAQQTKGPISDREMALFASAVPGLARSPLGNQFILDGMEKIALRQIDIDRLATEYVRENGLLDVGFDAFLSEWETQNPLFDDGERSLLEGALNGRQLGASGAVETNTGGTVDLGKGVSLQVIN